MEHPFRHSKPHALQVLLSALLLLLFIGAYIAAMRAVIDVSRIDEDQDAGRRDLVYVYVHLSVLVMGAATGFALGKWLNGLGIAYATLFLIVLAVGMLGVQMATYELACRGHNDLVRHWQC